MHEEHENLNLYDHHDHDAGHPHEGVHDHEHAHGHTHEHAHEHTHVHSHEHTHADGETHAHPHEHTHSHEHHHEHGHEHHHEHGHEHHHHHGEGKPVDELIALMKYMTGHNAAHTHELEDLAREVRQAGQSAAYGDIMEAVRLFNDGNAALSKALEKMVAE